LSQSLFSMDPIVYFNPGWHDFALVTIRCSVIGCALSVVIIAALLRSKDGVSRRKVDVIPLLLTTLIIDLLHAALVTWYYHTVPERVELDDYDRPNNLVYTSILQCTVVLNYLGLAWRLVACLEV
ncbi:hypothetical protein PFISCL1PPCAC_5058, partial [Pristionchus fissidentatus]